MSDYETNTTPIPQCPPPIIPVITQTQPSIQSLVSQFNQHIQRNEDLLGAYHDLSTMYQSSVRQVPLPAPTSMQITASPELNNTTAHRQIKESLNAVATDTSSTKRNASRAHLNGIRKKMEKTFDPEKIILTFLRDHYVSININTANLKFVNKKGMFGNWQVERVKLFRPFHIKDIDPILKAAPNVMNQNIHRLLLEDFMMLNPGDNVICLIRSDRSFLTSPGLKKEQQWCKWKHLLKQVMLAIEPMHLVQY